MWPNSVRHQQMAGVRSCNASISPEVEFGSIEAGTLNGGARNDSDGRRWPSTVENCYDELSEEHDLPVNRRQCQGGGAALCADHSQFVRRRDAPHGDGLSDGEERRRVDR